VDRPRCVVQVGLDESGENAGALRHLDRRRDRPGREIHARRFGTEPGPGQRVQAEVALQMDERLAPHVAERFPVGSDDPGQPRRIAQKAFNVPALQVEVGLAVPVVTVRRREATDSHTTFLTRDVPRARAYPAGSRIDALDVKASRASAVIS
jgi:hypothetical protein